MNDDPPPVPDNLQDAAADHAGHVAPRLVLVALVDVAEQAEAKDGHEAAVCDPVGLVSEDAAPKRAEGECAVCVGAEGDEPVGEPGHFGHDGGL